MQKALVKFSQQPLERGLAEAVSTALMHGESRTLTAVCTELAVWLPVCIDAALKHLTEAWASADAPQAELAAAFAELAQTIVDVGMTLEPLLVNVNAPRDTDTEVLGSHDTSVPGADADAGVWDIGTIGGWEFHADPAEHAEQAGHAAEHEQPANDAASDSDVDSELLSDTDTDDDASIASEASNAGEDAASVSSTAATTAFHDFDTATAHWERMLACNLPSLLKGCAAVSRLPHADPRDVSVLFSMLHFWLSQRTSAILWATAASSSALLHTCFTVVRSAGVSAYDDCAPTVPGLDVAYACIQSMLLSPFWAMDAPVRAQLRAELRSDVVLNALQIAVASADTMAGLTDVLRCVRAALLAWPASSAGASIVAPLRRVLHAAAASPHCVKGMLIATMIDLDTEVTRNMPAEAL